MLYQRCSCEHSICKNNSTSINRRIVQMLSLFSVFPAQPCILSKKKRGSAKTLTKHLIRLMLVGSRVNCWVDLRQPKVRICFCIVAVVILWSCCTSCSRYFSVFFSICFSTYFKRTAKKPAVALIIKFCTRYIDICWQISILSSRFFSWNFSYATFVWLLFLVFSI